MRFFLFTILAIILTHSTNGQTCTCESNFEWLKKTFEENDAGFQYIIDKKGEAAYNIHNQLALEKIRVAQNSSECNKQLYEWLTFFRFGHIWIEPLTQEETQEPQTVNEAGVYEMWTGDIASFKEYISQKKKVDYEGIWQTGGYQIGIRKEGVNYIGFIIESDIAGWKEPGQIKLKIEQDDNKLTSTYFMRDHSPVISDEPEMIGSNYLQIGPQLLKRLEPHFQADPLVEAYYNSIESTEPYLEELHSNTLYLHIPSFEYGSKSAIDKIIAENREKILKTENLIIDLRNNGGGSDQSFHELLPFLYTNPIRTITVEFLSTPLNNLEFLNFSNDPDINEDTRRWAKDAYDKLEEKQGEFVCLHDNPVVIRQQDSVYPFPKNIGIIINEGNASTTEQFLLAAKQSKKVKLFGVTTAGALDISNMSSVESPCKEFRLWYCTSRSLRIPGMTIDDIGLQPDFYLDKSIPQYKWIEFVKEVLKQ
ncbi:hypothetical protein LJC12_01855 [Odoribacter sp. OttesenSCG-928-J03]|nr:hypothetical protein [Odoribacter sp. OttesenSCG-928-J03]